MGLPVLRVLEVLRLSAMLLAGEQLCGTLHLRLQGQVLAGHLQPQVVLQDLSLPQAQAQVAGQLCKTLLFSPLLQVQVQAGHLQLQVAGQLCGTSLFNLQLRALVQVQVEVPQPQAQALAQGEVPRPRVRAQVQVQVRVLALALQL